MNEYPLPLNEVWNSSPYRTSLNHNLSRNPDLLPPFLISLRPKLRPSVLLPDSSLGWLPVLLDSSASGFSDQYPVFYRIFLSSYLLCLFVRPRGTLYHCFNWSDIDLMVSRLLEISSFSFLLYNGSFSSSFWISVEELSLLPSVFYLLLSKFQEFLLLTVVF